MSNLGVLTQKFCVSAWWSLKFCLAKNAQRSIKFAKAYMRRQMSIPVGQRLT